MGEIESSGVPGWINEKFERCLKSFVPVAPCRCCDCWFAIELDRAWEVEEEEEASAFDSGELEDWEDARGKIHSFIRSGFG